MRHQPENSNPKLRLTLFGGFDAVATSGTVLRFPTKKTQALVGYLALETNTQHFRAKLAALLWGDVNDEQARDSLRHALHEIKGVIEVAAPRVLIMRDDKVALAPAGIDVDVIRFERLIADGSHDALGKAAAIYKGELLEGLTVEEEPFEQWVRERRERLRDQAVDALQALLDSHLKSNRPLAAIDTARRLLAFDPLQETVHRTLMRLYAGQGRRGIALRQYEQCVDVLQRQLAAEPEQKTKTLYQEILCRGDLVTSHLEASNREMGKSPNVACDSPPREVSRAPTLLIGRDPEIGHLQALLSNARGGNGACVFVLGDAGIGKSRLVSEISAVAARQGVHVLYGCCYESEQILFLGPWLTALRSAQLHRDDELRSRLSPAWKNELAWLIPELAPQDETAAAYQPDYRRVFEAVLDLLTQVASTAPTVLVLEDLQWADDISVRLLAFLARRIESSRILCIVTARNEEVEQRSLLQRTLDELMMTAAASVLELGALCQVDALALVQSRSVVEGGSAITAGLASEICDASQGSPFLIVETIRALREGLTFAAAVGLPLSKRIAHVVHARIQRLSDTGRSIVVVAAVMGHASDLGVMARAAQLPEARVADAVEEMVRRHILHATGDRVEFTHDWIKEVIYASLLPTRQRLIHEQVAAALEATCYTDWEVIVPAITFHYRLAKVWDKAAFYARKAGEQALSRCGFAEASALFEQAQAALGHLAPTPEVVLEAIDVRLDLHRSLVPTGVAGRTIENLREAEKLIATTDDARRAGQLALHLSQYFRTTGDHQRAIDYAERGIVAAQKCDGEDLIIEAKFHLGQTLFWRGQYRSAITLLEQSLDPTQHSSLSSRSTVASPVNVASRTYMSWAAASLGDFRLATRVAKEAIYAADAIDAPLSRVVARRALGWVLVKQGDFDNAIPLLEEALRLCQTWHIDLSYSLIASSLGFAYAITGSIDEGLPLMERAVEHRASLRGEYPGAMGTFLLSHLAEGYLLAGRIADAAAVAQRAARLADSHENRVDEAHSLRLSGDIAAQKNRPDVGAAQIHYAQSRAIAASLEMQPFVAQCDLRLGSLLQGNDHMTKGHAALHNAHSAFASLDMPFWAARAKELMAKPAIREARRKSAGVRG